MPLSLLPRRLALTLLCAASLMPAAQAGMLTDQQWRSWLDSGRYAELERAAGAKLAQQDAEPQATLAMALVALDMAEPARLDSAAALAQRCVERQPQAAGCHYALGSIAATQALQGGMLKAARLAPRIRDSLARAVDLEPDFYEARSTLQQFYMMAPAMIGGSMDKARSLATSLPPQQAEHAKVLRAQLAMQEKRWPDAERDLAGCKPGDDKSLQSDLRDAWSRVAVHYRESKRFDEASTIYERLARDYPGQALGPYGLGRVALDRGALDESIKQLERARSLDGSDRLPVDHRLGQAWLAKGDKAKAREALERFVAQARTGRTSPRNLEDARKLLAEMG